MAENQPAPRREWPWIAALIAIGVACSLYGINWGLPTKARVALLGDDPDAIRSQVQISTKTEGSVVIAEPEKDRIDLARAYRRYFLYSNHPDEMLTLMSLSKMHPSKLDFHPHLFQYGGLFVYPLGALIFVGGKLGLVKLTPDLTYYLQNPEAFGRLYVVGRLFVGTFVVGTAVMIYCFGRRVADRFPSFIGATLFLVSPGAIVFSHEMKPHAAAAFFVLLAFYWLFRLLEENKPRYLWLATIACGAATAMVFTNEILLLAVLCCVWFVRRPSLSDCLTKTMACCALLATVYFAFNPYVLLDFKSFLAEAHHVKNWYEPGFHMAGVTGFIRHPLIGSIGLPTTLLAFLGFIHLARTHKAWTWIVLSIMLLYCVLLVHQLGSLAASPKMARLVFALFPLFALAATAGLGAIRNGLLRCVVAVASVVWIGSCSWPYLAGFRLDATDHNTRVLAGRWINENIPAGSTIGITPSPAPYKLPPFAFEKYRLALGTAGRPDYVVTVGSYRSDPFYTLAAGLSVVRADTPLSFASQPVYVFKRSVKSL